MVEHERRRDVGVRLIVFLKGTKALAEVALALWLVAIAANGEIATLREVAINLKADIASRWSLWLGRALAALLRERGVHVLELGLALDGILSAVEGWSLWRGYRWGAWLVVASSSLPLPLEAVEIARTHSPWRIVFALLNVAVVAYLVRQISRGRDAVTADG